MPFPNAENPRLSLAIDGQVSPDIAVALLRWELVERPKGAVRGVLEVASAGAAANPLASLRLATPVALTLAAEQVFDGSLIALEGRASGSASPSVTLHVQGKRALKAAQPSVAVQTLRVGAEALQAQVRQEGSPVVSRLSVEMAGAFATGEQAIRVGSLVALVGLGSHFDGRFRLQEVALGYDATRGLYVAATGQR